MPFAFEFPSTGLGVLRERPNLRADLGEQAALEAEIEDRQRRLLGKPDLAQRPKHLHPGERTSSTPSKQLRHCVREILHLIDAERSNATFHLDDSKARRAPSRR